MFLSSGGGPTRRLASVGYKSKFDIKIQAHLLKRRVTDYSGTGGNSFPPVDRDKQGMEMEMAFLIDSMPTKLERFA